MVSRNEIDERSPVGEARQFDAVGREPPNTIESIRQFIERFASAANSSSPEMEAYSYYAGSVSYFDKGMVTPSEIEQDIVEYRSRFSQYTHHIEGSPFIAQNTENEWNVEFSLRFAATGTSGKAYAGTSEIQATVSTRTGEPKIIRISARRKDDVASIPTLSTPNSLSPKAENRPTSSDPPAAAAPQQGTKRPNAQSRFVSTRDLKSLAGKDVSNTWFTGDFVVSRVAGNTVVMYPIWSGGFVRGYSTEIRATFVNGIPNFPGRNRLPMDPIDSTVGIQIGKAEPARIISIVGGERGKVIVRAEVVTRSGAETRPPPSQPKSRSGGDSLRERTRQFDNL
jgi:hypothetical protein